MRRLVYTSLAVHTCPYLCYYFITKPVEIRVKGTFTNNYAQDTACKDLSGIILAVCCRVSSTSRQAKQCLSMGGRCGQ